MTTAPVTDAELATAKNQLLAGKLLDRETNAGKASVIGEAAAVMADPSHVNTDLAALQAVTPANVQEVAKKWFTDPNRLIIEYLPESMKTQAPAPKKAKK